jgi:cytochrome c oxidase subunit 1
VLFGGAIFGIFAGIYHYFPKMTGRFLGEGLGKWHFWLFFIGMNLAFFPMHFSGLYGMPRRIYTYDAGQGWEWYNLASTIGAFVQGLGLIVFAWNLWKSYRSGEKAGSDPWGAPTLEWTIPSPPPDYNFAKLPTVTSRYPMWDAKGRDAVIQQPDGTPVPTARQLGIPMPTPTIKPLVAAFAMTAMIGSLIFLHTGQVALGIGLTIGFGVLLTATLYSWLLTPVE